MKSILRCQDIGRAPRLNTPRGDPELRITGKVSGDEGWDGYAVIWCLFSLAKMMGTSAALIDRNATCLKSFHLT